MTDEGRGKASDILRRRDTKTSKLQRAIERAEQRSLADETPSSPPTEEGRPAKPIRITVDLNTSQHRFLREFCLDTGTKGTAVLRGLLAELAEDEELRSRLMQRLKQ
jgi:hypothetical protein